MNRRENTLARTLIREACTKYRDRPLASFAGESWTYGETWERGGRLASALAEQGLEQGDRVAQLMSNRLEYFAGNLACVQGGFVNVPLNDMLTPTEYEFILSDSKVRAVVVGPNFTDTVEDIRPTLPDLEVVIAVAEDPPGGQIPIARIFDEQASIDSVVSIAAEDPLRLTYTGGTTGRPKGAYQTHGAIGMMMLALALEMEVRPREEMLFMTPLAHAAGFYHLAGMTRGAHFTLTQGFDAGDFLEIVDERSITWTFMVPTMLYRVLGHEDLPDTVSSSLDTIVYGAAPISPRRLSEALDVFGPVFIQLFGQTETSALTTSFPKTDHVGDTEKLNTVGQPAIMTEVRITDPDDETATAARPPGEAGEILVRAPFTFDHYHGLPEKTRSTIVDGWVRTGDIGQFDSAGYLYLLDRKNDVIITGGMNVYSSEVERVLDKHRQVEQVAVIGIPHGEWGEAVHAVIVPEGDDLSAANIKAFAHEHLSAYKKPKSVEFVGELPKTAHGKIDKSALREAHREEQDRQIG